MSVEWPPVEDDGSHGETDAEDLRAALAAEREASEALRSTVAGLQAQLNRQRRERDRAAREAEEAAKRLDAVYRTPTWRIGRAVMWLPRRILRFARRSAVLRRMKERARLRGAVPRPTGDRAAVLRIEENAVVRSAYEAALARSAFSGHARGLVIGVSTTALDEGRGDLYTAIGLGRRLEELGYEVIYRPPRDWMDLPHGTDVFLSLLAERHAMVDPLALPADVIKVAWIRNLTERWVHSGTLPFYDGVLCSSSVSLRAIRRVYDGPSAVLPLAVDDELFRPGEQDEPRHAVVSTVNAWGRERQLHRTLRLVEIDFPLVLYGQHSGVSDVLSPYARGPVSFFALASVYRQAAVVLDDQQEENQRHGTINSRIFESLACGALPVTNSRAGLDECGLDGVPVYDDVAHLAEVVSEHLTDGSHRERTVDALAKVVREQHSYSVRAAKFDAFLRERVEPSLDRSDATTLLGFFPDYRHTNPYQEMLYSRCAQARISTVPTDDPVRVVRSGALRGRNFVFHVHWTAPILGPARSRRDAQSRLQRFLGDLDELVQAGTQIVWTVHNIMPHECSYPDLEQRLRAELASRADLVHIMCPETPALVEGHFALPADRLRVIPHGSYVDVYPNIVDPLQARLELGLERDAVVFLFLGGIRPYKGLEDLLDAFEEASAADPRLRLLVVGRPGRFGGLDRLRARCENHPAVVPHFEPVPDHDLQVYLNACDVVVLPHRQVLNSGGLLLAWSFGRPVIARRAGCLTGQVSPDVGRLFSGHNELVAALSHPGELLEPAVRQAAFARAAAFPYTGMSREFVGVLTDVMHARRAALSTGKR